MSDGTYGCGWIPDVPDHRDLQMSFGDGPPVALPAKHDRLEGLPRIWNQGEIGSCAPHGALRCFLYADGKVGNDPVEQLSRLMLYYNVREMEGTIASDAGSSIRDNIKSLVNQGCALESEWPYVTSKFTVRPPQAAYSSAKKYRAMKYASIQPLLGQIKAANDAGFPVVFGTPVYESIFSNDAARTGRIPVPQRTERMKGGHAMVFNGHWDDELQELGIDNSWGAWGNAGVGYLPYWYVVNGLVSDCWVIYTVTEDDPTPIPPTPSPTPTPSPAPVLSLFETLAKTALAFDERKVSIPGKGGSRGSWD